MEMQKAKNLVYLSVKTMAKPMAKPMGHGMVVMLALQKERVLESSKDLMKVLQIVLSMVYLSVLPKKEIVLLALPMLESALDLAS